MNIVNRFIKHLLPMNQTDLSKFTLANIEQMMIQYGFDHELIEEINGVCQKRIDNNGERAFQAWFSTLHFQVPEEFQDEAVSTRIYDNYHSWIETEVKKLELETGLSWETQTEDCQQLHEKARKAQLVIRHRLSEISLDLLDE